MLENGLLFSISPCYDELSTRTATIGVCGVGVVTSIYRTQIRVNYIVFLF